MGKGKLGGRYQRVKREFEGKDAGQPREPGAGGKPVKRKFIGSKAKEYSFVSNTGVVRTITATSYKEALRIAASLGFTESDYRAR